MKILSAILGICLMVIVAAALPESSGSPQKKSPIFKQRLDILAPVITGASGNCLSSRGEFMVTGKSFGVLQGNRRIRVNGQAMPDIVAWNNELIIFNHNYQLPAGEPVKIDIIDSTGNRIISNSFEYLNLYCICRLRPDVSIHHRGSALLLYINPQTVCARKGSIRIKLDGGAFKIALSITSCNAGQIPLTIPPSIPTGDYLLFLEQNGKAISNQVSLKLY